jgi:hypothetical protein
MPCEQFHSTLTRTKRRKSLLKEEIIVQSHWKIDSFHVGMPLLDC